jgi:hypothetical protein
MWKKIKRNALKYGVSWYEKMTKTFLTFHTRPRKADQMNLWADAPANLPLTAIAMQGPLLLENDFTLETVKLYRKNFPNVLVIVSTWIGEDEGVLSKIEQLGATVVRSKKPSYAGPFNINMQVVSAYAGMKKAKEMGAEYALKSRTDQRLYAPNAVEFMLSLIEAFPYTASYTAQKKRIVACSLATLKYRPYGITDMNVFGHIDDMLLYWNPPLDERPQSTGKITPTIRDFTKACICEIYLATEFMKKIGRTPQWTMKDSFDFYADHIVIADQDSLDVYWRKYEHYVDNRFTFYDSIRTDQDLTFREWLNLYAHRDRNMDESILDLPFRATITHNEKNN